MKRPLPITLSRIIKSTSFILFILTLIVLLPVACKKERKPNEEPIEPLPKNSISLDKTSVTPGDIVTLTSEVTLNRTSWEIKAGSKVISLVKVDDKTAVLMVPYVPAGVLNLDLGILGESEKKSLTITGYVPVSDPEQVKNEYLSNLDQAIADNSTTEFANTLTVLKETFKAKYPSLSTSEKQELAFFLQKLDFNLPDTAGQTFTKYGKIPVNKALIEVPGSIDSDKEYVEGAIAYMALSVKAAAVLVLSAEACAAPTGITQAIGVAGLGYAAYCFDRALAYKRILFFYNARNISLVDLIPVSSGKSINAKAGRETVSENADLQFNNEQERWFNVSSLYQGVSTADESSENAFFRNIVIITNRLTGAYNKAVTAANKIRSWFSSDPKMFEVESGIPATASEQTRTSPANLIKIENISDANISLAVKAEGQILKITATSSVIKDKRAFTFDLVYNFPAIGISNRKKMTATFNGDPCMGVTDAPVINSVTIGCTGGVEIDFTSKNSPVKSVVLYWKNTAAGFPEWNLAKDGNSYSSNGVKSGDGFKGVYQISVYGIKGCYATYAQTPLKAWQHFAGTNEWKIELVNTCGKVSASSNLY